MIEILALFSALASGPLFAQIPVVAAPQAAVPQTTVAAPAPDNDLDSAAAPNAAATAAPSSADLAAHGQSEVSETASPSPAASWSARWSFLQDAAKNSDYAGAEAEIVDDLNALVAQNPQASDAPQARFLAASLEERQGLHQQAMVDLLHLLYEFPGSSVSLQAQSMFQDIANKRLPNAMKPAVMSAVQAPAGAAVSDRLAALIHILVGSFGQELYDVTRGEIRGFMARFPDYAGMDQIQWDLVRLNEAAGYNRDALVDAQELLALYPQSALAADARFNLGSLYVNLKLYEKAVGAYQTFTADYPQSPDALSALSQIATIFAEHLKQYDMAVKTDEMIISQAPQGQRAAEALYQESGIYDCRVFFVSCKLDDAAKAQSVYQRIIDSGNLEFLDKKEAERVRSRINALNKALAKQQAQAPQAAAPASGDNQ